VQMVGTCDSVQSAESDECCPNGRRTRRIRSSMKQVAKREEKVSDVCMKPEAN
jgi:hypothetical protein